MHIFVMSFIHEAHVQTSFLNTPAPTAREWNTVQNRKVVAFKTMPCRPLRSNFVDNLRGFQSQNKLKKARSTGEQIHILIMQYMYVCMYMLHIHFPFATLASLVQAALHIIAGQLNEDPLLLGFCHVHQGFGS